MFFAPIVGLLFFQGNFGNIYDYYLTGYYLIFILLFAIVLGQIWKYKIGKIFVIYFMIVFLGSNLEIVRYKIIAGVDGPETIAFGNQKQALDWIYKNAQGNKFNVDEYVPPVIPYAYDYLLKWENNPNLTSDRVPLLYTLYEVDPPHPERLDAWLKRQNGIGRVVESVKFGGITVDKRIRYTKS
jgi:hypothetical protein